MRDRRPLECQGDFGQAHRGAAGPFVVMVAVPAMR
jgi:hypothetical protein